MLQLGKTDTGRFCWLDLAATDSDSAKTFYGHLFGWTSFEQPANGGSFTRLRLSNEDIGSIYQLREGLLKNGIPSHWTPYARVDNVANRADSAHPGFGRRADWPVGTNPSQYESERPWLERRDKKRNPTQKNCRLRKAATA